MNVSGLGTTADVVLTAPGSTERTPSEAARSAAPKTTTTSSSAEEERDTFVDTRQQEADREHRVEKERQEAKARQTKASAMEGLKLADMLTILGMRPVSTEEAARLEQAKAQAEAITGSDGSFDLYA